MRAEPNSTPLFTYIHIVLEIIATVIRITENWNQPFVQINYERNQVQKNISPHNFNKFPAKGT